MFFIISLSWALPVAGLPDTRALLLLAEREGRIEPIPCSDDGQPPDTGADGIWNCGQPVATDATLGLLADGLLLLIDCAVPTAVQVEGGQGRCVERVAPGGPQAPRPFLPQIVIAVQSPAGVGAPVLVLEGSGGSVQLGCRNDGRFPDQLRNDDRFGCAGVPPGDALTLSLNSSSGQRVEIGQAAWEPGQPLRYLQIDVEKKDIQTTPIGISLIDPAASPSILSTPGAPSPPEQAPPAMGGVPPRMESPPAAPYRPAAVIGAGLMGIGIGLWLRRPVLPPGVRSAPPAAILPGLPATGAPLILRAPSVEIGLTGLLPRLSGWRLLLVGAPPPVASGGPVLVATDPDRLTVEDAILSLARQPGLPLLVILAGGDALRDPGSLTGHPASRVAEALPDGVRLVAVLAASEPGWGWSEYPLPDS